MANPDSVTRISACVQPYTPEELRAREELVGIYTSVPALALTVIRSALTQRGSVVVLEGAGEYLVCPDGAPARPHPTLELAMADFVRASAGEVSL